MSYSVRIQELEDKIASFGYLFLRVKTDNSRLLIIRRINDLEIRLEQMKEAQESHV